jgi:hypothetical protein
MWRPDLTEALRTGQVLSAAGIAPRTVTLTGLDLEAARWADQPGIDWILLLPSLAPAHEHTVTVPVRPRVLVPFTLLWRDDGTAAPIGGRFVTTALAAVLPSGWSPAGCRLSAVAGQSLRDFALFRRRPRWHPDHWHIRHWCRYRNMDTDGRDRL